MAEEKVSFGFEFGVKGDKEVRKGLEDIFQAMGNAKNAATGLASALARGAGLLELGAAAGPIGVAAAAIGVFSYKAQEAGENLRRLRQDMVRLDRVPSSALTDSELGENDSALVEHFKDLGIETGNRFNETLLTKLQNFGKGAYAVNWDFQASIANLFGADIKSYESTSPEAQAYQNRLAENQKTETDRTVQRGSTQQDLFAIRREAAQNIDDVYNRLYMTRTVMTPQGQGGARGTINGNGAFQVGVLPESYEGQKRLRDIQLEVANKSKDVIERQSQFDANQLRNLRKAPLQNLPGTTIPDVAGRQKSIVELEAKLNDELEKQLNLRQDVNELNKTGRDADRAYASAQHYGPLRALGLGGRGRGDTVTAAGFGLNSASLALGGHRGRITGDHVSDGLSGNLLPKHSALLMEQIDVLKNINKGVSDATTPTLKN